MPESTRRVIYKCNPDRAAMIAVLLTLGVWDLMSPEEREAAVERGEIWDTPPGRAIGEVIERSKEREHNARRP